MARILQESTINEGVEEHNDNPAKKRKSVEHAPESKCTFSSFNLIKTQAIQQT